VWLEHSSQQSYLSHLGQEQFRMYLEFQNEIDETMFLAQQKAELCLGESYVPRKVLVSSYTIASHDMTCTYS